jgi:hypothetical protein
LERLPKPPPDPQPMIMMWSAWDATVLRRVDAVCAVFNLPINHG